MRYRQAAFYLILFLVSIPACAQTQTSGLVRLPAAEVLDQVLNANVLTYSGVPFHAVLNIQGEKGDSAYRGRVEIFWAAEQKYRLQLTSPDFDQILVVNGPSVEEQDRGDFYPGWLHGFVNALLDPIPRQQDIRNAGPLILGQIFVPCLKRDDRPGGITDEMTWANVCFSADGSNLEFVDDFTYNMEFHDFKSFGRKRIARTYISSEGDHARLHGSLITLEDIKQLDENLFAVSQPTPAPQRILTTFVPTAQEESMLESAPKDVIWPTVREGPANGFMIVQAITDRTGQVREASKHNSDNAELETFGRELALKYKFKPLVVDGTPEQMEMPLVLHFTTKLGDPIPELDDSQTRKLVSGCDLPHKITDPTSAGHQIEIVFQITDDGHLSTLGSSDRKIPVLSLFQQFRSCHFAVYEQNGKPTPYHAHLSVKAK